jgi:acetyl esterase/lipase
VTIPGKGEALHLRIVGPSKQRGIYLHIHGGCWTQGTADIGDDQFERLAAVAGIARTRVDYRLAREHLYPAAIADYETAALWLFVDAQTELGTDRLAIGGESAGAHLSVLTSLGSAATSSTGRSSPPT